MPISATANNDMVYILGGQAPTEDRYDRNSTYSVFEAFFLKELYLKLKDLV